MEYTQKVKRAEAISELMLTGSSEADCRSILAAEEYSKWDIDKIIESALKDIRIKYGDKIRNQMLEGTLESHIDDYEELSAEIFEMIQYDQIDKIQRDTKREIDSRLRGGEEFEEIRQAVVNKYFPNEKFDELMLSFDVKNSENTKTRMIGIGAIMLGLTLTILSQDFVSNGSVVFYGLIIFGIWNLIKAHNAD